jgi:hypothetical protein
MTDWRESGRDPVPLAEFDGELNFDRQFRGHTRYRVVGSVLPRRGTRDDLPDAPISEPFRITVRPPGYTDEVNAPEHVDAGEQKLLWFGIDNTSPASEIFQIDTASGFDTAVVPVDCQTLGELSYVVKVLRRGVELVCRKANSALNLVFAFGYSNPNEEGGVVTDPSITAVFGDNVDGVLVLYVPVDADLTHTAPLDILRGQLALHLSLVLTSASFAEIQTILRSVK